MPFSLNGKWKVNHFDCGEDISTVVQENFVPEGWLNAQIPEDIHATLRRAGVIRGNTYHKHENEELWIEQRDWVYYKEFMTPQILCSNHLFLRFEGLDTFCDIYLNGSKIGSHQNMHIACEVDIAKRLHFGARNVLVVRFYSPVAYVNQENEKNIFSITTSERIFARKAQMNYSWDFCGRCVTVGIWKPVLIVCHDEAEIDSYYLFTREIVDDVAMMGLEATCVFPQKQAENAYRLKMKLSKNGETVFEQEGTTDAFCSFSFSLSKPCLWWPRPYGEPFLYDFSLCLMQDSKVIDEKHQKLGIRTIKVLQEPLPDGRSFQFEVNGKKLFIRGANWVPINTIYTDITKQDEEVLIHYAVKGNISMLRIWGGGIYESHSLFQLCDEHGILLWNDFMLSCGIYPQNQAFLSAMGIEAEQVIKTYRNYACLAIWAGDNENGQAYGWAGRPYEFENDQISNTVLKNACQVLDPQRFYLSTSPASPYPSERGGDNPSSPYQGDQHIYIMSADPGVNANRDYGRDYYKRITGFRPRFMSEFGFISLPEKESYYRFNFRREPLRAPDELIKFLPFTAELLKQGEMDLVIYYSQVFNSLALKYWIEYFRSLKGTCSGTLYWKFNDPLADCPDAWMYPSHMCAVDMYLLPKMTYYYTRRAYENLTVVLTEAKEAWNAFVLNEEEQDFAGILSVCHLSFEGKVLHQIQQAAVAKKDASTLIVTIPFVNFMPQNRFCEYIKVEWKTEQRICENRYYFADLCELNQILYPETKLCITSMSREQNKIELRLYTEKFARCVRVNILDCRADYSDNYFDMDAGMRKHLVIDVLESEGLEDSLLYIEGENMERLTFALAEIRCE